jgi:hypothetical protein
MPAVYVLLNTEIGFEEEVSRELKEVLTQDQTVEGDPLYIDDDGGCWKIRVISCRCGPRA